MQDSKTRREILRVANRDIQVSGRYGFGSRRTLYIERRRSTWPEFQTSLVSRSCLLRNLPEQPRGGPCNRTAGDRAIAECELVRLQAFGYRESMAFGPVVATFAYLTQSERDGVADDGEILKRLFEIFVVLCGIELTAMTNDDCSDVAGERRVLSDLDQSIESFRRHVVGAFLEECHRKAISHNGMNDLSRQSEIQNVLVSDTADDLVQDLIGEVKIVRVGHDCNV